VNGETVSVRVFIREMFELLKRYLLPILVIIFLLLLFFVMPSLIENETLRLNSRLFFTFSGVSVTLFGGGYVFIPMLQELVVNQLNWVSEKEFIDGIALGQITPGPIMISATFIGYKVAGWTGAISATIGIFLPPALLMIFISRSLDYFKNTPAVTRAFRMIHPAVIGMIFAALIIIGRSFEINWLTICIFGAVFILAYRFKVNVILLIPLSGLVGLLFG